MKHLLLIITILGLLWGCKKQASTQPPPVNLGAHITNNQTTLNTVSLAEAAMVGHWTFDSMVYYNNGIPTSVSTPSNSGGAYAAYQYDFITTPFVAGADIYNRKCVSYGVPGQAQTASSWYVTDGYLNATGRLYSNFLAYYMNVEAILVLNSNQLVLGPPQTIRQGQYYFFHK